MTICKKNAWPRRTPKERNMKNFYTRKGGTRGQTWHMWKFRRFPLSRKRIMVSQTEIWSIRNYIGILSLVVRPLWVQGIFVWPWWAGRVLLFICKFIMTLAAKGTLEMDGNIQYLRTLVRGEALHQFYLLYADVKNTEALNVDYCIIGLVLYFSL